MARPQKCLLEEKLRKMGLKTFDPESIVKFYRKKYEEYLKLRRLIDKESSVTRSLVELLEELRGILKDENIWIVVKTILVKPGAITGEVTRGYGMDHREALSDSSWLVKNGYIVRGESEFDPLRERYVRRQYPSEKLITLLKKISKVASLYEKSYNKLVGLHKSLVEVLEALRLARRYAKYFVPEASTTIEDLSPAV